LQYERAGAIAKCDSRDEVVTGRRAAKMRSVCVLLRRSATLAFLALVRHQGCQVREAATHDPKGIRDDSDD
jgi:hypothetical protein